jgi:hypothetical protein
MLKFDGSWRFHSPGKIAEGVVWQFNSLIGKIAAQGRDRQRTLEHFKSAFANAAGSTSSWSSNASWAETDLLNYMQHAAENAPLFIEAFYEGCVSLGTANPDIFVPDAAMINRVLAEHDAGYEIQPPDLIARNPSVAIAVPERTATLDQQAQDIIQQSLRQSDQYLVLGQYRQAVQEILGCWRRSPRSFRASLSARGLCKANISIRSPTTSGAGSAAPPSTRCSDGRQRCTAIFPRRREEASATAQI